MTKIFASLRIYGITHSVSDLAMLVSSQREVHGRLKKHRGIRHLLALHA